MITNGRFYSKITGETPEGNGKYSSELKQKIEMAGQLCLENLNGESFYPIMLLGSIQSGKTRAFIGLMSLCFDNGFDMTIILTKCSTALVRQTVSRMSAEFADFRTGMATVGDVVAQDILDIDFSGKTYMHDKEAVVTQFLRKYKGKKRIIVVKKQADNVDRMNMFIEQLVKQGAYKRILIVDDEADITSIGYEKNKAQNELSLRRISGAINTMRKQLHSNIEHVLMQVTATPYALYLQPNSFFEKNIMPVKPRTTVVLPRGNGYIGGEYYFIDSEDVAAPNHSKAKYLTHLVNQNEMDILNGSKKNSGKNSVIHDGRTVKIADFIKNQSVRSTFAISSLRSWIFDILVGTAIIQLNQEYTDFYVSAVLHAAISKELHRYEKELIIAALNEIVKLLEINIDDEDVTYFIRQSYNDLRSSVEAYGVLRLPDVLEVRRKIASATSEGELEGIITEVDVKEVNSDKQIELLLNDVTGELKLESSLTIFVGGQVLDRGITIPNLISFFYGRDPATMQQDTVMQHCRMFGYRVPEILSVTRFYTTYRLYSSMREITLRDNILRERMTYQNSGNVVYLESGGKIKACSPQKILASNIHNIMPEKRYLPIGFEVNKKNAKLSFANVEKILVKENALLEEERGKYRRGENTEGKYVLVSAETALNILIQAYETLIPSNDGICNVFKEMESIFLFSLSECFEKNEDKVALVVRRNRALGRLKHGGLAYQDAPDDGNNEGALAKELRKQFPVIVLTEQCAPEWGAKFWWPVYYTPVDMNVGIYAEEKQKTGVGENIFSLGAVPIQIKKFEVLDNIGIKPEYVEELQMNSDCILQYYNRYFNIDGIIEPGKARKQIECSIIIYEDEAIGSSGAFADAIKKIKTRTSKLLKLTALDEMGINRVLQYFDTILERMSSDEVRETALQTINAEAINDIQRKRIIQLIDEADDLLNRVRETLGFFVPTGAGKCEIHLYYATISEVAKQEEIEEGAVIDLCKYVMAHEMFHALHYADVMTASGRWLYKNKDYHKQGVVQESLAEYFALCYSKEYLRAETSHMDVVKYIYDTRNEQQFPKDGGYSGAIILERQDNNGYGKECSIYSQMYKASLDDMPMAFNLIPWAR